MSETVEQGERDWSVPPGEVEERYNPIVPDAAPERLKVNGYVLRYQKAEGQWAWIVRDGRTGEDLFHSRWLQFSIAWALASSQGLRPPDAERLYSYLVHLPPRR